MKTPVLLGTALSAVLLLVHGSPSQAATSVVGRAAPTQAVDLDIHIPLRNSAQLDALIANQSNRSSPLFHHFLSPAQFRANFGPATASVNTLVTVLRARGLPVTTVSSQLVHVHATAASVGAAFKTQLNLVRKSDGTVSVAPATALTLTPELITAGASVSGLATGHTPRPYLARAQQGPANRYAAIGPYWFDDLKQAYDYPGYGVANGKGVTVATLGESDFSSADEKAYFAHELLGPGGLDPKPRIEHLLLGGQYKFDPNNGASDEADIDVQEVGGSAPGARVLGTSINGPGEAFLAAYEYFDETNIADIVSTSYGECELYYTAAYNNGIDLTSVLKAYHDIFRQGNAEGITFVFSSGDNAGRECGPPAYFGPPTGAVYPSVAGTGIWVDDPNTTGVGGTNLLTTVSATTLASKYVSENELADAIVTPIDIEGTGNYLSNYFWGSGGGVSTIFNKPAYQNLVNTGANMRAVPDVSMMMGGCPNYGPGITVNCNPNDSYGVFVVGGQLAGFIGTSLSAPEFAGLLAVFESSQNSRLGNVNTLLYSEAAANGSIADGFFHQGIPAYNGVTTVAAGATGYNTINGVGTPLTRNVVLLPLANAAHDPQTPSNP